jgi:hypothetical protein
MPATTLPFVMAGVLTSALRRVLFVRELDSAPPSQRLSHRDAPVASVRPGSVRQLVAEVPRDSTDIAVGQDGLSAFRVVAAEGLGERVSISLGILQVGLDGGLGRAPGQLNARSVLDLYEATAARAAERADCPAGEEADRSCDRQEVGAKYGLKGLGRVTVLREYPDQLQGSVSTFVWRQGALVPVHLPTWPSRSSVSAGRADRPA